MILNDHNFSKEAIKSRMLQNAAKLWGVRNVQLLDPFVKLLVDAFSTEIFKANNEIQSVNGRILEKLARLLTPTRYSHPAPAHAVAFCMPSEDRELLMEHSEFFLKKQVSSLLKNQSDRQVEIAFTPVMNVNLVKAQSTLMIAGGTVYSVDSDLNKMPIARVDSPPEDFRTVRLGIDVSSYSSESFPEEISLYCSNPAFENLNFLYQLLPYVDVTVQGKPLSVKQGITEHSLDSEGYQTIFEDQSIRQKIKSDVIGIYNNRFIEVSGITPAMFSKVETGLPQDLDDGSNLWEPYRNKKFIWLKMEFPPQFSSEILSNFNFVLNAFPVYNRAWKKTEYTLDIMGNNIPLVTAEDEYFLYVDEVMDGQGKAYFEIPFTPAENLQRGLYTLRKGGMERFTNRNATDLMAHLMELLRDEVAAFSVINRDKVKDVLSEISDKMKGLMKRIEVANRELHEDVNYVIIEPLDNATHTFATYWVSHCTLANGIRPGTEMYSQKRLQHISLLTATAGGREEQKQADTIQAYRYALTTRDKIISAADIKNYCRLVLQEHLKDVTVRRGTMVSNKPKEGFVRTVDVEVTPRDYAFYGKRYWNGMVEILQNGIASRAVDGVEYRVIIKEENPTAKVN